MMHFIGILLLFSLIDYREIGVEGFANPKSDFLFEIDGNSVSVSREHACAIEQKPGSTIGGRAKCWGLPHLEGREEAPNDVSICAKFGDNYFNLFSISIRLILSK